MPGTQSNAISLVWLFEKAQLSGGAKSKGHQEKSLAFPRLTLDGYAPFFGVMRPPDGSRICDIDQTDQTGGTKKAVCVCCCMHNIGQKAEWIHLLIYTHAHVCVRVCRVCVCWLHHQLKEARPKSADLMPGELFFNPCIPDSFVS